jgi:hypothetical protein
MLPKLAYFHAQLTSTVEQYWVFDHPIPILILESATDADTDI